jgi:IPT/TIG domain/PASTA domain
VSKAFRLPILLATLCVLSAFAASAQASTVTVGSLVTSGSTSSPAPPDGATIIDTGLAGPAANVLSPISGVIVRWRLTGFGGGPFYLQVLTPDGGTTYTGVASSAGETPASTATQTFATDLPIQAGQTIGVASGSANGDAYGTVAAPPASFTDFNPPLPNGSTMTAAGSAAGLEFTFNAEVQPPPTITALGSTSGSTAGGASVTITGTDFEGTGAVKFGTLPAASFTINSEGQITATAPAAAAGPVNVSVTTPAGTATSAQRFTYAPALTCTVPRLIGKKLKAAKKSLTKADCKVGKVQGEKSKSAKVTKQSPKPGKVLPPGAKVNVKLTG